MRLFSVLLMLLSLGATAQQERFHFEDPAKRQLFNELSAELRCPKCQNQNIADSNAMVARDLKRKTYQLVQQGQSKQQVIEYMKQRYGDFVYYQPPVTPLTSLLWLLPVGFILLAIMALVVRRRRQAAISEDILSEADKLLDKEEQ
ncbi:Cytochrome c-type bioproteinis protein CcmH [Saliniradius amylolyticus]|uniref:Cytochrome c-type biogenesis protein n=1 Tax=Saliniradius amylolyticus TaxID=2183582 RepID=A0A2S2E1B5_9ALTE|nr:cytochrome c-type biogenesis protein [Saliniradius amylolyticus]AWL11312.1 Cytochrome c-type bioproteinis protein CcmH [Saliniradius amylolyticus]